jgi:hypothetical protein
LLRFIKKFSLGKAFIILKLCGVINWSWWWVLSPLWIPIALLMPLYAILYILKDKDERKPKPEHKSRWQEKMEEMKSKQRAGDN